MPYAIAGIKPLVLDGQPKNASETSVDQPTERTGSLYDFDMPSMHNSDVAVTALKHIARTTTLDLQRKTKLPTVKY